MSIDRWMDKEAVVHIYTMEYYSTIKMNAVSSNEVDKPRAYQSEVSRKSKINVIH